ncbi:uncharacterized protein si:dkeyp-97a10.2 [Esox lucius]|uniref:uncharacterized protein si:dkeyp-97a10.2 n=1 Tax=Esox lucius TaxID=8010 RepID=UPI001477846C|nr:uncharacterized protein si:dkeyp-97a10.2 [Esox lucius]XP_010899371.2 uncharacterized protein si:dkeyp-97a10.2 [Esox lucius]
MSHRWSVSLLLLLLWPSWYHCMTIHFQTLQPVYAFPAECLVLQIQINHDSTEKIAQIRWERETGNMKDPGNLGKVTLITFPGQAKGLDGRLSLDQQGTVLKLEGFGLMDSGVYIVTVTDQGGAETSAQCVVKEYEAVHHPSVRLNVSHSSLYCVEAWGTDLRFSWLHEQAAITDAVGHVSPDGKTLFVSSTPICGHFTCVVRNKLGHSSATYTAEPCKREGKGTTVAGLSLILLLVCGGALAFLLWRRYKRYSNRGQRLRDDFEDNTQIFSAHSPALRWTQNHT